MFIESVECGTSVDARRLRCVALLVVLAATYASADDDMEFSADLTLTTDYIYRGVSQTMSSAAVQFCIEASHSNGIFGYLWGSNVDFVADGNADDGARVELDVAVGYSQELTDRIDASVSWMQYTYPGTMSSIDYDYSEWAATISLDERHGVSISYSPNVFASGKSGLYVSGWTGAEISSGLSIFANVGYYDLRNAYGESYANGSLGISGESNLLTWQLSYNLTERAAELIFDPSTVQPTLVLAMNLSF